MSRACEQCGVWTGDGGLCRSCDPPLYAVWNGLARCEVQGPCEIDTDNDDEVVCPFCGVENADSWELSDEGSTDCGSCGQTFFFSCEYTRTFTSTRMRKR